MSDLISRQAAIDAIVNTVSEIGLHDNSEVARYGATFRQHEIIDIIEGVPSAQQWIPCSERLPEENTPVNITWANRNPVSYYADIKDVPFTATGVYFGGKWYWWSSIVEDLLAEYGRTEWDTIEELIDKAIDVIAWMPLPEPYRKDEEKGEAE